MRNYILFSPNADITSIASRLSESATDYHLDIFTNNDRDTIVKKASSLTIDQYDLVIARGMMVDYIKPSTNIPVVEMRMTIKEMIALIKKAIGILKKKNARISIIGSHKLFPDVTFLSDLFQCTIRVFYLSSHSEVNNCVDNARQNGYDMVIGGQTMCQYAAICQMPYLNISGSQDSLLEALRVAEQICDASDIEKKNRAEISVLLDYSVNGIIKINHSGMITGMNRLARELLRLTQNLVENKHISSISPNITSALLHQVIDMGMSVHSLFLTINSHEYLCNFIPLTVNHYSEGAILSFQAVKTILNTSSIVKRDLHQKQLKPSASFNTLVYSSDIMKEVIREAKILSLTSSPVYIFGENGTEREQLAECIHMESVRWGGPFIHINCKNYTSDAQRNILLGYLSNENKNDVSLSPFSISDKGTLLLQNIDALSIQNQEFLYHYLTTGSIADEYSNRIFIYDVRIIATGDTDLGEMVSKGTFSRELYFHLASLSLNIPPLRVRKDDLVTYIQYFIKHYSTVHSRLNTLSAAACKRMEEYPWPGNITQLSHFCERLVLFSHRKIIGDNYVSEQLLAIYPNISFGPLKGSSRVYYNAEAKMIAELMNTRKGNRNQVAEDLKISRSTLWRKIKKYGLDTEFNDWG